MNKLEPQPKQAKFLKSKADIAVYGGSAGGGKTYALLLEPLYHIDKSCFSAVIFRRNLTQVKSAGGLWDTANEIYPLLGAEQRISDYAFTFQNGVKIKFGYLESEKDVYKWQGSQIPLIMFDELTHFSKKQFFYMLSRNRTGCKGIRPYIRATTNPDVNSWVREFIDWWIGDDGLPVKERDGVIRYFVNVNDNIIWNDSREELQKEYPHLIAKSFTFVSATLYDNKILMENDPAYLSNLMALPKVERDRLLGGNWNVKESAGMYYKKEYFEIIDYEDMPNPQNYKQIRCWDLAYTEKNENNDPDYLVGLKGFKDERGYIYVTDIFRDRLSPAKVEKAILGVVSQDGKNVIQRLPIDPSAGKKVFYDFKKLLRGYPLKGIRPIKDKITRTLPASKLAEDGYIKLIRAKWNNEFLDELESFPDGKHDDQVDTLSDLIDELENIKTATKTKMTKIANVMPQGF